MKVKWKGKPYPEAEMSARDARFVERTVGEPIEKWTRLTQSIVTVFAAVRAVDPDAITWDELDDMPVEDILACLVEEPERKVPLDRKKKAAPPPRKRPATRHAAGSGSTTGSTSTGAT